MGCDQQASGTLAATPKAVAKPAAPIPPKVEAPLADLAGFPLKNLAPAARRPFAQIAQEELCGCDNPRTLAGCLAKKDPCDQALVLGGFLKGLLEAGVSRAQTQLLFSRLITDGMCADQVEGVSVLQYPSKSNVPPGQPAVEVIEFADFMCSHCAQAVNQFKPLLNSSLPVRMYFVPVQLGGSEISTKAAIAALAAWRQGATAFWAFHDKIFEHQLEMSEAKILALATEVGIDIPRWQRDRKDPALKALFKNGQALGQRAGLQGTPYVLINGRPLNSTPTATDLAARIQLEMLRHRKECEQ
jgi:protein-disulfide isomerase